MGRVKKCSRCSSLLNWNKPYCPICGGYTVEAPDIKPTASPVESAPTPEPAPVVQVAPVEAPEAPKMPEAPVAAAPEPVAPPAPAPIEPLEPIESPVQAGTAAIPGLEYLEEKTPEPIRPAPAQEAAAPPKAEPLTIDILEPLEPLEMSSDSFSGIQKGSGGRVELTPRAEPETQAGGSFERFDAPQEIKPATPDEGDAMFEKRSGEAVVATPPPPPAAPTPSGEPPMGEFLKMFPDAKPD